VAALKAEALAWTDETIAYYTGCALTLDGVWVWPNLPDRSDLANPVLFTDYELTAISPVQEELQAQIRQFLTSGNGTWWYRDVIRYEGGVSSAGWGLNVGNPSATGYAISDGYIPALNASMGTMSWLSRYVTWWSGLRQISRPADVATMNPMARGGYDDAKAWMRAPWPFELNAPYQQASFYRWLIDSGQITV
jgi:hypothetical protein